MAIDYYAAFKNYKIRDGGSFLLSESTSVFTLDDGKCAIPFKAAATGASSGTKNGIFELQDFTLDVEQQLNISSQSTGTGAGRVKFNNFSITRQIDVSSADMFNNMCVGTPFDRVYIGLRKSGGLGSGNTAGGKFYVLFTFAVVAVAKITWAHDDERPKETIEFGYGALQITYGQQQSDGTITNYKDGAYSTVTNQNVMPDPGWNGLP